MAMMNMMIIMIMMAMMIMMIVEKTIAREIKTRATVQVSGERAAASQTSLLGRGGGT